MKFVHSAVALSAVVFLASGCSSGTDTPSSSQSSVQSQPAATSTATTAAATPSDVATPTATSSPTGPVILTKAEAGARYFEAICPSNDTNDAYDKAYDDNDSTKSPSDRPSQATKAAAEAAYRVTRTSAELLGDPGFQWPANVSEAVSTVVTELNDDASIYKSVVDAQAWSDAEGFTEPSQAASKVRFGLGLAAEGGCFT